MSQQEYKLLRRMPNEAMVEAGRAAMSPEKFVSHCRTVMVWQAMFDAAPAVANPDEDYVRDECAAAAAPPPPKAE